MVAAMSISLEWLPASTRASIEAAVTALESALGDGLAAICLIGPAATPGRDLRGVHAELLVVAESLPHARLHELAAGLAAPLRAGLQIRTVTREELRGSVDVHALEIATWRERNQLLAGRDPFASLTLTPADLRHEIERALRTLSHRLRNRVLWCLATQQRRLDSVLREGVERLIQLAHHTLLLVGEQPLDDEDALLEQFAAWAGAPHEGLVATRRRLVGNAPSRDALDELTALTRATEAACRRVDALSLDS